MLVVFLLFSGVTADFCSQFADCESCAGRHRVTFEVCHWCPTSDSCVPVSAQCRAGYQTIFDCPRLPQVEYNETFVRLIVTPLIAAAQGTHDQMNQCLDKIEGKLQLWRRFYVTSEDGRERPDGFIAVDFTRRAVIISFSSVSSGARLLYNRFNAEFFTNRQAQFEASNGLVNRLIYDSWFKVWYVLGMENVLKQLLNAHPDFELWILGHSIGGAKADMTAVAVALKNITSPNKIRLITFGATRVGDLSFVEMIETTVSTRFRIINKNDMVTRYPKEFDGEWTPPHHHRYEVWYPQGMGEGADYFICFGAEDQQCSSRLSPWQLRAEDNDIYFERSMPYWALSGCSETDRISKVVNQMIKLPTIPPPVYNLEALKTLKPYSTTEKPTSLLPTQPTPKITLPPKHLLQLEIEEFVKPSTEQVFTTTTVTTTTKKVFTLPWWYTTQAWSSSSTTSATHISKQWDEGKQAETEEPKIFTSTQAWTSTATPWSTTTLESTTFRNSFRNHSFRPFEKIQNLYPFGKTTRTPAVVERERTTTLQTLSEIESRLRGSRLPKGPHGKPTWNEFKKIPQRRPVTESEGFLTVVDREAEQAISWNDGGNRANDWKFNGITRRTLK